MTKKYVVFDNERKEYVVALNRRALSGTLEYKTTTDVNKGLVVSDTKNDGWSGGDILPLLVKR